MPEAKKLILLVDGDENARGIFSARLQELGHKVLEFRDGTQALKTLSKLLKPEERESAVVVCDLTIDMGGTKLAYQLRESYPAIPFLLLTPPLEERDLRFMEKAKVDHAALKTVAETNLATELQVTMDNHAVRMAAHAQGGRTALEQVQERTAPKESPSR